METLIQPIREASRQLVRELHLLDGRHCIAGYPLSECHLLTELEALEQATASELAERLVLEKSTMSRLVNGMLDAGYISSSADPADGRRRILRLTAKGQAGADRINRFAVSQVGSALEFVPESVGEEIAGGLAQYARALHYARLAQDISIRPIEEADNPMAASIIRDVMTEYGAVGPEYSISDPEVDAMYQAYRSQNAVFYVVETASGIQGIGGIAPLAEGSGEVCELQKMYFRPELRGTGTGSRLLKRLLHDARELGYQECYLETLEHMSEARHLYAKYGFEPLCEPMGNTGHAGCNSWMLKTL